MIDALFAKFEGAFAENTIRGYRHDFDQFAKWCVHEGIHPLPAPSISIAAHIDALSKTHKAASIRRRINALSTIYRLGRMEDTTKDPDVTLTMKRMHRKLGRAQKQAAPLTKLLLNQLLSNCDISLRGLRNQVLLRLGYETMRRRSELCAFKFEDIRQAPSGKPSIRLNFSKTDQFGAGKILPIRQELFDLLGKWKGIAGNESYILRSINKHGHIGYSLNPARTSAILKTLLEELKSGSNEQPLNGHSFRVGAAIYLLEHGEPLERIMLRGGWQTASTAMKYLRNWAI